jgi:hypothetical protein
MAIPSTNIELANDIYGEANGGYPGSGAVSLNDISFYSYFVGPNGTGSISYNAYGKGENSGLNRIYGTNAVGNPDDMDDFKGVTYFYDNTNFLVKVNFTNNLPAHTFSPPPGTNNDITINVTLFDSSFVYTYGVAGNQSNVSPNGGTYNATISQTNSPIIFRGYWNVEISPSPQLVGGAQVDITINGSAKVTNGTINAGPTPTSFDSATYGTEDVAYNATLGGTGLLIVVTCHT